MRAPAAGGARHRNGVLFPPALFVLWLCCCLAPPSAFAVTITADTLQYSREEDTYVATGNVVIEKDGTLLHADRAVLHQDTSDAEAEGNVRYEDMRTIINAERASLNLDTKTGTLYNALIHLKDQKGMKARRDVTGRTERIDYWIRGDEIRKLSESHYYAKTATFTTCTPGAATGNTGDPLQAESTPWCIKGNEVDVEIGEKMRAKDATFRIKGLPVLYTPYLWAPIMTERQTGFLYPLIGNSSTKGFRFSPSFYWAIDENKDATFTLDYYSKRGLGKGIEYRYLDFTGKGQWYAYHLHDRELDSNFIELRGSHEQQWGDIRGFADVNYINHRDFYKEYAYKRDVRTQRFLQSSAELSAPVNNTRLYLLSQYWVDLLDGGENVPQRLPELGYVINPSRVGPLLFSLSSSAVNFWREEEVSGQRVDINPVLSYSFGNALQVYQSLSLRETLYQLRNGGAFGSSLHRETFEYKAHLLTRFRRVYSSATHTIEPSLTYAYIPGTRDVPLFDSIDSIEGTSQAKLALLNTVTLKNMVLAFRVTQPYTFDPRENADSLEPTLVEAGIYGGPFTLSMSMTHDFNEGRTETFNTTFSVRMIPGAVITLGENYTRASDILQYNAGIIALLSEKWSVDASAWYDSKGQGLRDTTVRVRYTEQCWATELAFTRRPGDSTRPPEYSFALFLELRGLGGLKTYEYSSQSQQES
ncbi:MAG: LPS-assembly protein LptD [Nitrospirales bacterium]|nr:LPS-assembly protein LptD [Nitrospirales bacterium]